MLSALCAFVDKHRDNSMMWRTAVEPTGTGAVILIEGPSGMGKTSLMKHTVDLAQRMGIFVIDINFDSMGRGGGGGFTSWFNILNKLFVVGWCTLVVSLQFDTHCLHFDGTNIRRQRTFISQPLNFKF